MNETWRSLQLAIIFLFISALILGADIIGITSPLRQVFNVLTTPFQRALYLGGQRIAGEASLFIELRSALQKANALERQYQQTLAQFSYLSNVSKENEILKRQFAHSQTDSSKLLPAKVIGLSRYLLISGGSNDGVKVGQVVILENSLIGRVVEVDAKSARVMLPTDSESKITISVSEGERNPKGVLVGDFGVSMHLEKILPEEKIEVGDFVLTAGNFGEDFGFFYPKGLLVGRISKVNKADNQLFQEAEVEPIFDYHDLNLVFVRLD